MVPLKDTSLCASQQQACYKGGSPKDTGGDWSIRLSLLTSAILSCPFGCRRQDREVCVHTAKFNIGHFSPAAPNNSKWLLWAYVITTMGSSGSRVNSSDWVCMESQKEKKNLVKMFTGEKEGSVWKLQQMVMPLPLLFYLEWLVLVCRTTF